MIAAWHGKGSSMSARLRIEIDGRSEAFATPEQAREELCAILSCTIPALLEASKGKTLSSPLKDGRGRTVGRFSFEWEDG
jgi:hypothetical protein